MAIEKSPQNCRLAQYETERRGGHEVSVSLDSCARYVQINDDILTMCGSEPGSATTMVDTSDDFLLPVEGGIQTVGSNCIGICYWCDHFVLELKGPATKATKAVFGAVLES